MRPALSLAMHASEAHAPFTLPLVVPLVCVSTQLRTLVEDKLTDPRLGTIDLPLRPESLMHGDGGASSDRAAVVPSAAQAEAERTNSSEALGSGGGMTPNSLFISHALDVAQTGARPAVWKPGGKPFVSYANEDIDTGPGPGPGLVARARAKAARKQAAAEGKLKVSWRKDCVPRQTADRVEFGGDWVTGRPSSPSMETDRTTLVSAASGKQQATSETASSRKSPAFADTAVKAVSASAFVGRMKDNAKAAKAGARAAIEVIKNPDSAQRGQPPGSGKARIASSTRSASELVSQAELDLAELGSVKAKLPESWEEDEKKAWKEGGVRPRTRLAQTASVAIEPNQQGVNAQPESSMILTVSKKLAHVKTWIQHLVNPYPHRLRRDDGSAIIIPPPERRFHLYLSHIWLTGQDRARCIKFRLKEMLPEARVFLDIDTVPDKVEAGLPDFSFSTWPHNMSNESDVFLVVCSDGYCNSRNCMRELRAAVANGRPLIALLDVGVSAAFFRAQLEAVDEKLDGEAVDGRALADALFARKPIQWSRSQSDQEYALHRVAARLLPAGAGLVRRLKP